MINYKEKLGPIKAFVFDFDGVMTDGSVLTYADGETVRAGNIKDGFAVQYAVKKGYVVAVISVFWYAPSASHWISSLFHLPSA